MISSNFEALSRRMRDFPEAHLNPNSSINLEHRETKQKHSYIKMRHQEDLNSK